MLRFAILAASRTPIFFSPIRAVSSRPSGSGSLFRLLLLPRNASPATGESPFGVHYGEWTFAQRGSQGGYNRKVERLSPEPSEVAPYRVSLRVGSVHGKLLCPSGRGL